MIKDILLLFVGLIVGAMNAIAGGGMLLGFPAMLASGLSALAANATGNVVVLPGQIASAYAYRHYLRTVPKKYALLLIPCTLGALLGAYILRQTPSSSFESYVPYLIAIAVAMFTFQPWLHNQLHRHIHHKSKAIRPLVIIGIILFPLAIYGGYFGAGIGFVILAFLGFTKLKDIHQMNAMKNVALICVGAASIAVLANGSFINWHTGIVMAIGSTTGGYFGAHLAQRISSHAIRIAVIAIGTITAVYIAFSVR